MRVLIGTGVENSCCANQCVIRAFKKAGHDVCTAGAVYGRKDVSIPHKDAFDIDLPDKAYPETYTYDEILKQAPWKPDLVLQIEPHFYFVGRKPDDIKSMYWVLDPHRGGIGHRNMARAGNFDGILITQKFFIEPYFIIGKPCFWLLQAFDPERIIYDPNIKPVCDIAFIGETGLVLDDKCYDKIDNDGFKYTNKFKKPLEFRSKYGEYAERGMILGNLMEDFNVRIYKEQRNENYSKVIQKGLMGFQRSLFKDITLRLFEIMACHRMLLADDIPFINEVLHHTNNAFLYKQFGYDTKLPNFELDYEMVFNSVRDLLNKPGIMESIAGIGYRYVHEFHTHTNRVKEIENIMNKI